MNEMTTITPAPLTEVFRAAGEGPSHKVLGIDHQYKLLASESGGQFMAFEMIVPPGCGAPIHEHARDTESFYMLEGEITARFADGSHTIARKGDFMWVGAHRAHSFANEGRVDAKVFVVQSPGLEGERFFHEVAPLEASGQLVPERDIPAIGARHGIKAGAAA